MLDEIEISSPQPFDPGQALSKQAQPRGAGTKLFLKIIKYDIQDQTKKS